MTAIYRWNGEHFGFLTDGRLYAADGKARNIELLVVILEVKGHTGQWRDEIGNQRECREAGYRVVDPDVDQVAWIEIIQKMIGIPEENGINSDR